MAGAVTEVMIIPYISVKLFSGRSRESKESFALAVRQAAIDILGADGQYVTVAMQDVEPAVWKGSGLYCRDCGQPPSNPSPQCDCFRPPV